MSYMLLLNIIVVVATISIGLVKIHKGQASNKKRIKKVLKINVSAFLTILCGTAIFLIPDIANAATSSSLATSNGLGYIAAALSTGIATIGAGYAVGATGSSALGAISEDPKVLGKTLIFVGLAEGIAIYGLIISIMILSKL